MKKIETVFLLSLVTIIGGFTGKNAFAGGQLVEILNDKDLEVLREGFSEAEMIAVTNQMVNVSYDGIMSAVRTIREEVQDPSKIDPQRRQLILITNMVTSQNYGPLADHVYWGLMVGLSVDEIMRTFTILASYHGMPWYANAGRVMQKLLPELKDAAAKGGKEVTVRGIAPRLLKFFP